METRGLLAGQILFSEGEAGDKAYVVKKGKLKVSRKTEDGGSHNLAHVSVGSIVGEMALIDDKPRAATVVALEESTVLVITKEEFQTRVDRSDKVVALLLQTFVNRLRQQADLIVQLSQ
ncbi:MAG: cyclic nucleotide-binding domain-containing protein [Alphaproteobacteria bacterium]|nr:cyclic nucleotide-binding domain-containing protein [Alphaproteobacteria bacterium]MBF0249640.1 cyclic nucleotide-binding domain-containing protein [Alphaproteobacteria bacterium]